jgi:hypothetical protein
MATQPKQPKGLRETVSIVRYGSTIRVLGESFHPLNVHQDNPVWPQLDAALKAVGK